MHSKKYGTLVDRLTDGHITQICHEYSKFYLPDVADQVKVYSSVILSHPQTNDTVASIDHILHYPANKLLLLANVHPKKRSNKRKRKKSRMEKLEIGKEFLEGLFRFDDDYLIDTIFCKVADTKISFTKLYED